MINPLPLAHAMARRHAWTCVAFVLLIALAIGMGAAVTAQERALRTGSARAAERFDLIVAAPGSQTDLLLRVVFLQPGAVELLEGPALAELMAEPRAALVAPIGFGDSYEGDPVVGTNAAFVTHLSRGALAQGRMFVAMDEAVVGAASPLQLGDTVAATHGHGPQVALVGEVHPQEIVVVGRMAPTGSPWDRAIVVPIEHTWEVHGLGTGHPEPAGSDAATPVALGPPFDPDLMPGVPAVVVKPADLAAAYGLRNKYRTALTMAFFPAEELVALYQILGDVRQIMTALSTGTVVLLVAAILVGLMILMRLYRQRFAVLRALGASRSYIFAVAWSFGFGLIGIGSFAGLAVAAALSGYVSGIFSEASGIALSAEIGATEVTLAASVALIGAVLALLPAALLYRRPVVEALRSA